MVTILANVSQNHNQEFMKYVAQNYKNMIVKFVIEIFNPNNSIFCDQDDSLIKDIMKYSLTFVGMIFQSD